MASDWQSGKGVLACNKYMFENKIACDVTFLVGVDKEKIEAHKYVLISRSSVFYAMFCGSMATPGDDVVIPEIDVQAFTILLGYLYWEDANLEAESVMAVLYAAKKYAVQGLETLCKKFLKSNKSVDNVCTILEQANVFDDAELQANCLQFIFTNLTAVLKSSGIQELSSASLEKILEGDDLCASEEVIFEAALSWADSECRRRNLKVTDEHRRTVLGRLLYLIRFPIMHKKYFTNAVSRSNILSSEEKIEIFQFHSADNTFVCKDFATKDRSSAQLPRCLRFQLSEIYYTHSGKHAISFTSSRDVRLFGVLIYGSEEGNTTYDVSLVVYDKDTQVGNTEQLVHTNEKSRYYMYEVKLPEPVSVEAGQLYTIEVTTNGPPACCGTRGRVDVTVGDVTFHFTNSRRSKTCTSVTEGQIPGLLFR